ncbi:MAG: dephospho-CoA kinase [Bacteroidales bacterium]|nr:dephospho-CoA kinase [Candidatus Egerieousia equi]
MEHTSQHISANNGGMPAVLGITGGIGSGKTYVSDIFAHIGVPVYDTDSRTKALYVYDSRLGKSLRSLLGEDIFKDGVFMPKVMGGRIFSNPELLVEVEKVVHPAVMDDFVRWKDSFAGKSPYVIMESAILLEKPFVKRFVDRSLTVTANLETRIQRVMKRDSATREAVLARLERQWSDEQRISCSDFVIFADNNTALLPQVLQVHQQMLEFANGTKIEGYTD